jgi:hypothetical protein
MTATLTKIAEGIGALGRECVYDVAFTSTYPVAGEPINLTADFDEIIAAQVGYADAIADHGYKFDVIGPDWGTEITSTNVLLVAHYSGTASAVLNAVTDATDLTGVGNLRIHVIGTYKTPSNYKG